MDDGSDNLTRALAELVRLAERDGELRAALASLGRALAELAPAGQPAVKASDAVASVQVGEIPAAPAPRPLVVAPATINGPTLVSPSVRAFAAPLHAEDLTLTADKFDLKADGCAWHVKRRQLLESQTDFQLEIGPRDKVIMDRARALGGCWMWMCRPESPTPENAAMELIGECFRNAARATRLAARLRQTHSPASDVYGQALGMLAEALSALRIAIEQVDDYTDADQKAAFLWLREETFSASVFIERHMRLEDPADPQNWLDLQTRLNELESRLEQTARSRRDHSTLVNKVKYHAGKLAPATAEESVQHWQKIIDAVTQLVRDGVKSSNVELRDALREHIDQLPQNGISTTEEFDQVLREIDRYVASRETEQPPPAPAAPTPDVLAVRKVLAGKSIVLIGGQERRQSAKALIDAFGLASLDWQATRPHESHYTFESAISRPEVAVVLLAIRFSSHGYGEVSTFCERYDKPLVRLPAGYSPNQVAATIRAQVGKRLAMDGEG